MPHHCAMASRGPRRLFAGARPMRERSRYSHDRPSAHLSWQRMRREAGERRWCCCATRASRVFRADDREPKPGDCLAEFDAALRSAWIAFRVGAEALPPRASASVAIRHVLMVAA